MSRNGVLRGRLLWLLPLAGLVFWLAAGLDSGERNPEKRYGKVEYSIDSDYSKIKIRKLGNIRTLMFVRDSREEVVETRVDLDRPHELLIDYTKFMFLSYLFRPKQEKVLIVGLGGGAMVHFLKHYDPKLKVEAVEIDPIVVHIAEKYFNCKSGGNVKIVTEDAFQFLKKTEGGFDVIYMDAFLKPSRETDETGKPLHLGTEKFYREIQSKLAPGGVVVFNLNEYDGIDDDVKVIRRAFPQIYSFGLPYISGYVVVATTSKTRVPVPAIREAAQSLDRRFGASFLFSDMVRRLRE